MKEFINAVLPVPIPYQLIVGGLASLIITCISIAGKNYIKASEEFRNTIYTSLEGIYPNVVLYLSADDKAIKTKNSINPINTAGIKFHHFLPFFYVRRFKKALTHYCDTARNTNWDEYNAHQKYPEMAKPGYIDPKEKLHNAVDNLLKFAK